MFSLQFEAPRADETKKKDLDLKQVSENRTKKLKGGAKAQSKTENQLTKLKGVSCQKLQNGSSIRKTNESVDGTEKKVLTNLREPVNSFEDNSIKEINESMDVAEASFEAVSQNSPEKGMVSKTAQGQGKSESVEMICNKIEDEFNIPPWEKRNMKRKEAIQIAIQPETVSYENFNLFSVLIEDEEVHDDIDKLNAGVDIMSHQNLLVDYAEVNSSEKTVKKGNLQKRKHKMSRIVDILPFQNLNLDQTDPNCAEKTEKKVKPKEQKKVHKMCRTQSFSQKSKFQGNNSFHECDDVKQSGTKGNMGWTRCRNCFKTHFPYPKLCRWEIFKQKLKPEIHDEVNECITVPDEQKLQIKSQIVRIEEKEKSWEDLICETVFPKDHNSSSLTDLVLENHPMKLKGGAGSKSKESFKLKQFVSKIEEYIMQC